MYGRNVKFLILFCLVLGSVYCNNQNESEEESTAPAQVENPVKESELPTVVLIPEAENRLGIETAVA